MAPISTLTVRLSAQIAEFQSEFRDARKSAEQFAGSFEGIATRAAAVGTFIGNIAARIATSLASAFGQGIRDAIRLSSEFSNAFIGLSSVARAFGTDADAATRAAQALSSDGLLPLKDSATGLKNLLATGFSLDESVRLMNAFKDSAAFGRQGALSFGDAVRSATEGVKNGNSILVDNAGITKNLSQILKEAGFSAQDLSRASSDAGVRLALFNGILKESAAFTGDAARLTETYTGNVSKLSFAYDNLLATLGAAITENATVARAIGAVADSFFALNQQLVNNRNAFNIVSDGVIFLVRSFAGVIHAIDLVQTGFTGLQVVSNRLFEAFANIGIAMFKLVERAANLQKFLDPVNFQRHTAAAEEAREAYTFLEGAAQGLRDASRDATARSDALGNALQAVRANADRLARELQETRGKTVELGDTAGKTGSALSDELGGGAKKSAAELRRLKEQIKDVKEEIVNLEIAIFDNADKRAMKEGAEAVKDAFALIAKSVDDSFNATEDSIKEGLEFVKKTFDDIEAIINSFEPKRSVWQKFLQPDKNDTSRILAELHDFGKEFSEAIGRGIASGDWAATRRELTAQISQFISQVAADFVNYFVPGLGDLLQPVFKGIIDKVGQFFNNLFDRNKGRDLVKDFAAGFGGFDALHARLQEMGAEGERLWIKLTQGVGRNNPAQATAVINEVTAALDAFGTEAERARRRLDALGVAVSGVNRRAELFAAPFSSLIDAIKEADGSELDALSAKLAHTAEVGQESFERLGVFVGATFAGLVQETGDAIGAIRQLEPAFRVLQRGINEFGLTSTGVIDQLLGLFNLVSDATTGPILEAIQATGQIFAGLSDAGYMTADLFQTVAADIGASFRELEAKGGDVAAAMALSQPILQRLWEAQQLYGEITDETTAKLLKQAEEQGLVGAHMQDVNSKILDVLIAIADVFGAKIPEAIRITSTAGREAAIQMRKDMKEAADGIKAEFSGIELPPLDIKIRYDDEGFVPNVPGEITLTPSSVPHLASGGVVRRPTLALIGEAGPEAVVPLSQLASVSSVQPESGTTTVIFEADGQVFAEITAPHLPGVVRRYVPA